MQLHYYFEPILSHPILSVFLGVWASDKKTYCIAKPQRTVPYIEEVIFFKESIKSCNPFATLFHQRKKNHDDASALMQFSCVVFSEQRYFHALIT